VSDYLGKVVPDWIQKNRPEATRSMVQKPWFKGPKIAEQIPLAVDPGIRARLGAFKANVTQAVDALRTKINRKGAFNLALYDRLADALEKSQDDEAGRKLLQRSQDFISGKMDEEVFVAYLEKTLATPEQRMARLAQISAARPKVQTTIASEISARVSAVKVNVGDSVRTGDVLATLDDSELRTQLELATTDFKRTTQLFEQQLVPRAEYDTAQTNYHLATEMLKRATVVAPFDGVVVSNLCEVGGFAQQHQPLFVLEHTQPATGKLGDTKTLDLGKGVKMELVWIPPGEFMMGSNDGQDNEKPLHRVRLTKGFWMGKYEVTQEQYEAVIGSNPSKFKGSDNPVGNVSWDDAVAFCRKAGGRLPTEAEWEYACRAGTTTKYHSGDTDNDLARVAWYGSNSDNNPHPVGGKLANTWGLHDMHGNVWEWCADWYGDYPNSDAVDPTGPGSGQDRVLRGGSWNCYSVSCRSVHRYKFSPDVGIISNGFRVIVDAPEAGAPQLREHVQTPQVAPERIGTSRVPKLGDTKRLDLGKGVKLELVWIPPGEFMMGSAEYVPVHRVKLTKGFWMGKYEVTQEQYEAIMGSNPSSSKGANNPVELVSWDNAVGFCRKVGGRLPTEAEWEYACRAGTTTKYSSGDTESDLARVGWYGDNSGNTAHSVGGKEANAWGLYDMHGNVFEWCADWYGSYPNNEETNPTGAGSGDERVLRGGSWAVKPDACGSAVRLKSSPHLRNAWGVSFRVCLDFP
jgi:formylglycine-generating enzyme required for sulfatase activity